MRWISAAVLLAWAGAISAQTAPVLRTSGVGEIRLAPDWASVSLGISAREASATSASRAGARTVAAVWDALERTGVPRDSVKTTSSSVQPIVDYQRERQVVGYEATSTLTVSLHDLERLGTVIDAALGAGATEIQGIQQHSTREDAVRAEAITLAVRSARADAETLAAAAGGRLGALVELTTGREPVMGTAFAMASEQRAAGPNMPDLVIRAEVHATWLFIPTRSRN